MRTLPIAVLSLALHFAATTVHAQLADRVWVGGEAPDTVFVDSVRVGSPNLAEPAVVPENVAPGQPVKVRPWYVPESVSLLAGSHSVTALPYGLTNPSSTFQLGADAWWPMRRWLSFGIQTSTVFANFQGRDLSSGGIYTSGHRSFSAWGLGVSLRSHVERRHLRPFAEIGASSTTMSLSAPEYDYSQLQSWLGIATGSRSSKSEVLSPHVAAGLEVAIGPNGGVGFEVRRDWMSADFGELSVGTLDAGGLATLGYVRFATGGRRHRG
jgi:hypothetical protein